MAWLEHLCAVMYSHNLVCNWVLWKLMSYIWVLLWDSLHLCFSIIVHLCTIILLDPCVLLCENMCDHSCNTDSMCTPLLCFCVCLYAGTSVWTVVRGHPCVLIYQEVHRHTGKGTSVCTALLLHKCLCVQVQRSNSIFICTFSLV